MTTYNSKLPEGWIRVTIGEALELINGKAFKPSDWQSKGLPIIRIQNLNNPNKPFNYYNNKIEDKYIINKGDLLFAWSGTPGTSFGAHIWKSKQAVLNQHIFNVKFDVSIFDKHFLLHYLNYNVQQYISQSHGTAGLAHITKKKFEATQLLLPPNNEQKRISLKLEELFTQLDAGVESLNKAKLLLKRYRQSVLKSAMEGKLTAEWRKKNKDKLEPASELLKRILKERRDKWETAQLKTFKAKGKLPKNDDWKKKYKEPNPPDTTNLPDLPDGWVWGTAGQISEVVTGNTPSTKNPEYYEDGEIPFYRPAELNSGFSVCDSKIKLSELGAKKARILPKDTIMVTCIGATIGKTGIARIEGATNQQINSMVLPQNYVSPEYCYYLMISPFIQKQIIGNSSSTTLPILNKTRFEKLFLSLPSVEEQKIIIEEIERCFSICEFVEGEIIANSRRSNSLRMSILKDAFSGKLVPQVPSDEPASELLERIKNK